MTDKARMSIIGTFAEQLEALVRVMEHGIAKHGAEGEWKKVNKRQDCLDAMVRHVLAYLGGQEKDPESGQSHLAHAVCRAMMVMWFDALEPKPAEYWRDDHGRGA